MAFGSIELTTISRAQDYSSIKQNEDNKGFMDQTNISQQVHKNTEQRAKVVHSGDNTAWHEQKPDAKEKGKNEYYGDGGKKRKMQPTERVVVKKSGGFDVKV